MIDSETMLQPIAEGEEDWQLLQRLAEGDTTAGDVLFNRYVNVAVRVAYRLVGNQADAEDVVQNAFVGVLRQAGVYQGTNSAKAWILRIVVNHARMHLRGERRLRERHQRAGQDQQTADNGDPADEALLEDVRQMLDDLPEHERVPLWMHYREGLNLKEVAQALGRRESTVRTQVARGLHRLRETMHQRGFATAQRGGVVVMLGQVPGEAASASLRGGLAQLAGAAPEVLAGGASIAGGGLTATWLIKAAIAGCAAMVAGAMTVLWWPQEEPSPPPPLPEVRVTVDAADHEGVLAQTVSIEIRAETLPGSVQVLNRALSPRQRLRFAYSAAWKEAAPELGYDLQAAAISVAEVLDGLAVAHDLAWQMVDDTVVLYRPMDSQALSSAMAVLSSVDLDDPQATEAALELAVEEDPQAQAALISLALQASGRAVLDRVMPGRGPRWPQHGAEHDGLPRFPLIPAPDSPLIAVRSHNALAQSVVAAWRDRVDLRPWEVSWAGALGAEALVPQLAAGLRQALADAGHDVSQADEPWQTLHGMGAVNLFAGALAQIGSVEAEEVLLEMVEQSLNLSNGRVFPEHFAGALARHGSAACLGRLFGWLEDRGRWYMIPHLRLIAPGRLADLEPQMLGVLEVAVIRPLGDGQSDHVAQLAGMLGDVLSGAQRAAVEAMAQHRSNDEARFLATCALARAGDPQALAVLIAHLQHTAREHGHHPAKARFYRQTAMRILAALACDQAVAALVAHEPPAEAQDDERQLFLEQLAGTRHPQAVTRISTMIDDALEANADVVPLLRALVHTRQPAALAIVREAAEQAPTAQRAAAVSALAGTHLQDMVITALADPAAEVRSRAAAALGRNTDRSAITALQTVVRQDAVAEVRASALDALGRIGGVHQPQELDPDFNVVFIEALADAESAVRIKSAQVIFGRVRGWPDPALLEPLRAAARNLSPGEDKRLVLGAIQALEMAAAGL